MVYMGKGFGDIVAGRKSSSDFMREAEEFEARKKQRAMEEQMMPLQLEAAQLGLEKTKKDLSAFDADKIKNLAVQTIYEQSQGLPATPAGLAAIETMSVLEGSDTQYKPDAEGRVIAVTSPNPYQQYLGGAAPKPTGSYGMYESPPALPVDPMAANQQAAAEQAQRVGGYNPNAELQFMPMQLADAEAQLEGMDVGSGGQVAGAPPMDSLLRMPAAQGMQSDGPMSRPLTSTDLLRVAPGAGDKTEQFAREEAIKQRAEQIAKENDPKFLADEAKKANAKTEVSQLVQSMANNYQNLENEMALMNPDYSPEQNMIIGAMASDIGQGASRFMGTKAQEIRDQISTNIPLLTQAIKQAKDIGVKGMDTPRELEFYVQAAGSPKYSLATNLAALKIIHDTMGIGSASLSEDDKAALKNLFIQETGGDVQLQKQGGQSNRITLEEFLEE